MTDGSDITRRDFIKILSAAGGGLLLGVSLPAGADALQERTFYPNVWIKINREGIVSVTIARSEYGQGVRTSLAMLIAEELDADWSKVKLESPVADQTMYGNMTTTGSTSIRNNWLPLRQAGATARAMLIRAAADTWGVSATTCRAENGIVLHSTSSRRLSYGELADRASTLPVPPIPELKNPFRFRLIGTRVPRLDVPEKASGRAIFGIDITLPGMFYAAIARPPVFGAKVRSFNTSKSMITTGVRRVLQLPGSVAVIASGSWPAIQGARAVEIVMEEGPAMAITSDSISTLVDEWLSTPPKIVKQQGNTDAVFPPPAKRIDATYELPFMPHATMEPQNCTADFKSDRIEIWAPTQSPQWIQSTVASMYNLPLQKVIVHTTLLGGGYGRRLLFDYAIEAVEISRELEAPVKVVWTREDDMRHDYYRPMSIHRIGGVVGGDGKPLVWRHILAGPSISQYLYPGQPQADPPDAVDGAANFSYDAIPNITVGYVPVNVGIPVGWWQSVYHSQNAFVNESFIDELADAAAMDPLEFRRSLLPAGSRLRGAVDLAAEKSGWGSRMAQGSGRGIACNECFGSAIAHVAEVTVDAAGKVRVNRIVCALDCGTVVHPGIVEEIIQGAVAFALTSTLKNEITIDKGAVQQSNFDTFRLLAFDEMPKVEVYLVQSQAPVGGVGEVGVPTVAPAVCNAIFAATGKRIRRLPVNPGDLKG